MPPDGVAFFKGQQWIHSKANSCIFKGYSSERGFGTDKVAPLILLTSVCRAEGHFFVKGSCSYLP